MPLLRDRSGREWDIHRWWRLIKYQLKLSMPKETFDTWLATSLVADYQPPEPTTDPEFSLLTIHLAHRYAYEWVSHRLHKVIQRMVDQVAGYPITLAYGAPEVETVVMTRPAVS